MSKTVFEKNGNFFIKNGVKAVILQENLGNLSDIVVTDRGELKRLVESSGIAYPAKVQSILEQANTAVLRIIKQGWSINGNYYTKESLQDLPAIIKKQGSIQFKNHLEEGTKLDRSWEEIVSYTKYVWFDEATQAVYAAVKFPKEKKDTGWILNVIQEDPEMIGVSIAAAVYVTENFTKDGKTGDKVDGWAYFDSADYVIYASAGGQGIEASKVTEKINHAKESVKPKLELKPGLKENIEKFELVKEGIQSFMAKYVDNQMYYEIQAVMNSLSSFLNDCWWYIYDDSITNDEKLAAIKIAFDQAKDIIINLELWKNAGKEYDLNGNIIKESITKTTKENLKMTLEELKKQHPEAYASIMQEAQAIVSVTKESEASKEVQRLTKETETNKQAISTLTTEKSELQKKLDEYQVKEAVAAKKQLVARLIEEAKKDEKKPLISEAITPFFLTSLETMPDETTMKAAIEDRKLLAAKETEKPAEHKETPPGAVSAVDVTEMMKKVAQDIKK